MLKSSNFKFLQENSMKHVMGHRKKLASVLCLTLFASTSLMAHGRVSFETVANRAIRISTPVSKIHDSYEIVGNKALQDSTELAQLTYETIANRAILRSGRPRASESNNNVSAIVVNATDLDQNASSYRVAAAKAFQQFSNDLKGKMHLGVFQAADLSKNAKHVTYLSINFSKSFPENVIAEEEAEQLPGKKTQITTVQVPVGNQKTTTTTSTKKPSPTSVEGADKKPASTHFSLGEKLGLGPKSRIQINGFISAGSSKTNANNTAVVNTPLGPTFVPVTYRIPSHGAIGDSWNFNASSLVGIQISGRITNFLSAVVQLVADGDNTNGNKPYRVQAEWAFIRTQVGQNFQTRAGRFRLPAFLYSETQQVGYTYPWIFLPNEVYRIIPSENINGVDFIYTLPLGNTGWNIEFQPYYGAESSEFDLFTRGATVLNGVVVTVPQGKTADFDERNIYGAVISFANPYFLIRGTYIHTQISAFIPDFVVPFVGEVSVPLFNKQGASFYSLGGRMDWHRILLVAEFAHRTTPPQIASLTGYYVMLGVHLGEFLPNITFADIHTTNTNELLSQPVSEFPQNQHSYTLGLAYHINSNIVAKTSVSLIRPSGNGLFNANPGKKTVYLYGFSLDAIF